MKLDKLWLAGCGAFSLLAAAIPMASVAQVQTLPKAASPESVGFSSERLKRLDAEMGGAVSRGEVKGMATMLVRHGKVVSVKTYGDRAEGQPMTRDTIFRLASMSKPVTGVALMILFEEGKWRLDDPITKFIPEFAKLQVATGVDKNGQVMLEPMKRPPTMRELMSHRAGFGYGMSPNSPADRIFVQKAPLQAHSLKEMIDRIAQAPLLYQPGEHFSYSAGVDVEGYIIEKLSGETFGQFLQERVFAPLKMADTGFYVPSPKLARLAVMYATDPATGQLKSGTFGRNPTEPPALESGGGGLFSTLDDYSRFAQMLANKGELDGVQILAPSTVELMQSNSFPTPLPPDYVHVLPWMFSDNMGFGLNMQVAVNPRAAGRPEGPGTLSWNGATGVWWWADPANDVVFLGMIQNSYRAGPRGYSDLADQLVYQALVQPNK